MHLDTLSRIIELRETPSFFSSIKGCLLQKHGAMITSYIQPQMGGFVDDSSLRLSVLRADIIEDNSLQLKCSIFFVEAIGGCNCHDDPHTENGYCEMLIEWNDAGIKLIKCEC